MRAKIKEKIILEQTSIRGELGANPKESDNTFNPYIIRMWSYGKIPFESITTMDRPIIVRPTLMDDSNLIIDIATAKGYNVTVNHSPGAYTDPDGNTYSFNVDCDGLSLTQAACYLNAWMSETEIHSMQVTPASVNFPAPLVGTRMQIRENTAVGWNAMVTSVTPTGENDQIVEFYIQDSIHENDTQYSYNATEHDAYFYGSDDRWSIQSHSVVVSLPANIHKAKKAILRPLIRRDDTGYDGQKGFLFSNYSEVMLTSIADDGTLYTAPIQTTLRLTNLIPDTEVRIFRTADDSPVTGTELSTDTFEYNYLASGENVYIVIHKAGYELIRYDNIILDSTNKEIPILQTTDYVYSDPN